MVVGYLWASVRDGVFLLGYVRPVAGGSPWVLVVVVGAWDGCVGLIGCLLSSFFVSYYDYTAVKEDQLVVVTSWHHCNH